MDKPWMLRMNESLSGYTPEEKVERPGAARRHERQADRQASRADSNLTNSKLGCHRCLHRLQSIARELT